MLLSHSCSRGIGLDLTRRLLESSENFVIATARNPAKATALQALKHSAKGTLAVIKLDVADTDAIVRSVLEVKAILGDRGLDYLVNNAAVVCHLRILRMWVLLTMTIQTEPGDRHPFHYEHRGLG